MYYIGIDLGGTNIAAGIVDESWRIVVKDKVPTGAHRDAEAIIDDMAALCKDLLRQADMTVDQIAYAGIAAPGSIDPENGVIVYSNNIPFHNVAIREKLIEKLGVKTVLLENDANAAAYGEAIAGAAKGSKYSVMITLGTGVGGGIILDGKVYSGFNYAGAEIGHTVIQKDGQPCTCGRKGCFEAYASATALIRMTKEKMQSCPDSLMWKLNPDLSKVSGKTAFSAMKQGDKAGAEVVETYIDYLACGLANTINIFQPNVLCIGGGVCNEKDYLLKPLLEKIESETYGDNSDPAKSTQIRIAELGNDAGIIGAAALGLYQL